MAGSKRPQRDLGANAHLRAAYWPKRVRTIWHETVFGINSGTAR